MSNVMTALLSYLLFVNAENKSAPNKDAYTVTRMINIILSGVASLTFHNSNPTKILSELQRVKKEWKVTKVIAYNALSYQTGEKGKETTIWYYERVEIGIDDLIEKINYHLANYPQIEKLDKLGSKLDPVNEKGEIVELPTEESNRGRKAKEVNLTLQFS